MASERSEVKDDDDIDFDDFGDSVDPTDPKDSKDSKDSKEIFATATSYEDEFSYLKLYGSYTSDWSTLRNFFYGACSYSTEQSEELLAKYKKNINDLKEELLEKEHKNLNKMSKVELAETIASRIILPNEDLLNIFTQRNIKKKNLQNI